MKEHDLNCSIQDRLTEGTSMGLGWETSQNGNFDCTHFNMYVPVRKFSLFIGSIKYLALM
jgi:hypothetical protein